MSEQSPPSGNFVKAFIPGLIVGFVVGALVGVVIAATEGNPGKLTGGNETTIRPSGDRAPRDGIVEETQQNLEEGAEAVEDATREGADAAEDAIEDAGEAIDDAVNGADESAGG